MPAKLIVVSGRAPGAEFAIQDPVFKIGTRGDCEFRLDDPMLAPHAVTLEYRDNGYLLHNRSDDPVEVDGRQLELRESAPWRAGEEVHLGHGLVLRLDVDGDPAPAKAAGPAVKIEYDQDEADDAAEAARLKQSSTGPMKALQILVIIAAVPLVLWMLLIDQAGNNTQVERGPSFSQLLKNLEQNKADQARGNNSYRVLLQRAAAAELRGDRKEARLTYGIIRDTLLLQPRTADGKLVDPDEEEVWRYMTRRLGALYGG